ncbi:transcription intermediary factor 1-alpha-like [Mya arenaria]|uniref:transcription intermediary factor 1-alpha-like n=1 Tax=Mya arenaria TaxID=6604 RepID=UPI0022DEB2F3|nr:transcription intermediary factor 1-alpha-like [Mya arenaria]XP_052780528.1 transcription intermediary factor 1-alpha-like [Mya arenaria]
MDAVPGRNATNTNESASDTTYCQPCFEDGKKFPPEAFCPVCNEFLCSTCARVHKNMKLTKNHVLQDKSSMPSSFRAEIEEEIFTETCQLHVREFIKYYCPHHDDLLCGDCVIGNEEHGSCKVEKISQVAKQYEEGSEYHSLETGLGELVNDVENCSAYIQASMKAVEEESLTNINGLRKFKIEINQYLDKREQELLEEIEQKQRQSKTLLNALISKCQDMKSAAENLKSKLQTQSANRNQLLIEGKRAFKELAGLQTALEDVDRKRKVPQYTFFRDPATEQLKACQTAIGSLEEKESSLALEQQELVKKQEQEQNEKAASQQDNTKGEATFSFTVENISKLNTSVCSPKFMVRNLPWRIKAMRTSRVAKKHNIKSLGFYLQCNAESDSTSWFCYATAKLKLLNQKPYGDDFVREIQHLFNSDEDDWGYEEFIPWNNLLDPEQCYCSDDKVTLQVHVIADEPDGVRGQTFQ